MGKETSLPTIHGQHIGAKPLSLSPQPWYDAAMNTSSNSAVLDELIEPVARCFTPEVARQIVGLRASPDLQARLDDLADKCGEGTLTAEEHERYESYVRGMNFIGVLQARARTQLTATGQP